MSGDFVAEIVFRREQWLQMLLSNREQGTPLNIVAPSFHDADKGSPLAHLVEAIEDWKPAVAMSPLPRTTDLDFWLGSSRLGDLWILAVCPRRADTEFSIGGAYLVALQNPREHSPPVIAEILLRVYQARRSGDVRTDELFEKVVGEVKWPQIRSVNELLPGAPSEWRELPAELRVRFRLSEYGAVTHQLFERFEVETLEDAMKNLCAPAMDFVLLGYELQIRRVVPLAGWDVDWPLSRRGPNVPVRRIKISGTYPWEREPDSAVLYLYQHRPGVGFGGEPRAFGKPSLRLRVAGRSPENSINNYVVCAGLLRRMRKQAVKVSS